MSSVLITALWVWKLNGKPQGDGSVIPCFFYKDSSLSSPTDKYGILQSSYVGKRFFRADRYEFTPQSVTFGLKQERHLPFSQTAHRYFFIQSKPIPCPNRNTKVFRSFTASYLQPVYHLPG